MLAHLDTRGFLSFLILWLLRAKSLSGKALRDEIEARKGSKPNPGTIYPALKALRTAGFISEEKSGRSKLYHLTESGRKELVAGCRAIGRIFPDFSEICQFEGFQEKSE
jgi:DNA-binding PadR family transcriptional regulator